MLLLNKKNGKKAFEPLKISVVIPERNFVRCIEVSEGFDFLSYAQDNTEVLRSWISENGALLIRNSGLNSYQFAELCDLFGPVTKHSELSSPRTQLAEGTYTSTDHPANQCIHMHNEQSYLSYWPMQASFMCEIPAAEGGATPISDCRNFSDDLPEGMVQKLRKHGVTYIRNFGPESSISWRRSYAVETKEELEVYCSKRGMQVIWRTPECPSVLSKLPAFRNHIELGVECFFNNIVVASPHALPEKERSMLYTIYKDEMNFPINVTYGDGSYFDFDEIQAIIESYEKRTVIFPWRRSDIVIADNMLTAHGRQPYSGPRKTIVRVNRMYDSFNK